MNISNPFPERGVATRETFYIDYWAKYNNQFKDFISSLEDPEMSNTRSQFLVVAGDLGSGKTATLYHMERKIQSNNNVKALTLFWQLSTPVKNQNVIQSFYNDFLNQLQKYLIKNHNAPNLIGSTIEIKVNEILESLDPQQHIDLVDLLNEMHDIRMNIDGDNQDILDLFRNKSDNIKNLLEEITNLEISQEEIKAMERILVEGLNFLPVADSNLESDRIKLNMQKILEEIKQKFGYECIVLLIDEFDILIRNMKGELPENVLVLLRDFIIWFSPEAFKGYHFIGALFSENLERLQEEKRSQARIDAIYRRLISQIRLTPIDKFESFYEKIYLPYIDRAGIQLNYKVFELEFIRFIFHSCKRNFGTIFAILHEQFSSWQDIINKSYKDFIDDSTKNRTEIEFYNLIWNNKGLSKHFSKRFLDIIKKKDITERKSILVYLIRNDKIEEAAPVYEEIKTNLLIDDISIVSNFHEELIALELYRAVFPDYEEKFYINYKMSFRLFNLSGLVVVPKGPVINPGSGNESIYFQTFMKKFSEKQFSDTKDKDWNIRVNEGFFFLLNDFLTNNPNPFEGLFDIPPLVNSHTLIDFAENFGSQNILNDVKRFELSLRNTFNNNFKINAITVETRTDESTIDKIFLLIILPLDRKYITKINNDFIKIFKGLIDNLIYKNKKIEALLLFSRFSIDFNSLNIMFDNSSESKCWIHLIDRIIPISVEITTSISRHFDETIFLKRKTFFTYFCAAFEKLHNGYPEGESKTYYELLFSPNNDEAENNMLFLQKLLTHLFNEYQNMFSTYNHNLILINEKETSGEEPPSSGIQHLPNYIYNLSKLFNASFPIDDAGLPIRQSLDIPLKIGDFKPKEFKKFLNDLLTLSYEIPLTERRSAKLTKKLAAFSTLIEMHLIRYSIDSLSRKFSICSDENSLLNYFEEIVKENTVLNQEFDVFDIDLDCCIEESKGIEIIELLLDFLVSHRKIFRSY